MIFIKKMKDMKAKDSISNDKSSKMVDLLPPGTLVQEEHVKEDL